MTARRRQLLLRQHLADSEKHELLVLQPHELHPTEADSRAAAVVIGEDDLIGRQRHSEAIRKDHERARRAVPDDAKRRWPVALPQENRGRGKLDEERDVQQPTDATIPAT